MGRKLSETNALDEFSPAQRAVILSDAPRVQVIAAAGSGKTRAVVGLATHRLEQKLEKPGRVLVLSFSRKAVSEIRARLGQKAADIEVSTFHSFCFRHWQKLHGSRARIITEDERAAFLLERLKAEKSGIGGIPFPVLAANPRTFRRMFPDVAMRTLRAFHAHKREHGLLEFDDLANGMINALRENNPGAVRLTAAYDMVLVDEFQDTDPRQLEFLMRMNPKRISVVGDDWQAIYGFRGATLEPFLRFPKIFPGTVVHRLAENYRSLPDIVRVGTRVIGNSARQLRKRVRAVRSKKRGSGPALLSARVEAGGEGAFVSALPALAPWVILVRSNFRRRQWLSAGAPPDRVLTIHKAKGLEFPCVLLDLCSGWTSSTGASDTDEEIRILYVGISRAEDKLVFLHRSVYGEKEAEGRMWNLAGDVEAVARPGKIFER
ncbi:MAG: UvrD-helicase domain-containing protein [Spirochaetia bacterium]|nr:UvrD-helicase domain-containing protein [Spirochaetia bacterium]